MAVVVVGVIGEGGEMEVNGGVVMGKSWKLKVLVNMGRSVVEENNHKKTIQRNSYKSKFSIAEAIS